MAKKTETAKTFTEAEVAALLAKVRTETAAAVRAEKSAARAEKTDARKRAGWTLFSTTEERRANNVLAEGVYVLPDLGVIEASAVMVKHDSGFRPRFRLAANPIFGVNGDTDTDAERLVRMLAAKAKHAPEILAALATEYKRNAPSHVWIDKAAERKAKANG